MHGHGHFDDIAALLTDPVGPTGRPALSGGKLSRPLLGEVLSRVAVRTPPRAARVDIANGTMLRHQLPLSEGSVSKAVSILLDRGFLSEAPEDNEGGAGRRKQPGRPGTPVALSQDRWFSIGVHVAHVRGRPSEVTAVASTLDDHILGKPITVEVHGGSSTAWPIDAVARAIVEAVDALVAQKAVEGRREAEHWLPLLGIGVEVGAHVHQGIVVADGRGFRLGEALHGLLEVPVVVENDANALAARETYDTTVAHHDFALVLVSDEGVGSALVLGGRVYRGSDGMAGEIGHVPVPRPEQWPAVRACSCGQPDHVDVYATPQRIADALSLDSVDSFHPEEVTGDRADEAVGVFIAAGRALGHAIATLVTVANPKQVIVQLPPLLHEDGTSGPFGECYREAFFAEVRRSFSTGGQTGIAPRPPVTKTQLAVMGARAAAVRVFTEFIDHLAGIDGCVAENGLSAWVASGQAAVVGGAVAGGYLAGPTGAALGGVAVSGLVKRLSGPKKAIGKSARINATRRQRLAVYRRG